MVKMIERGSCFSFFIVTAASLSLKISMVAADAADTGSEFHKGMNVGKNVSLY